MGIAGTVNATVRNISTTFLGIAQTVQTIEIARWVLAAVFMLVANWACD